MSHTLQTFHKMIIRTRNTKKGSKMSHRVHTHKASNCVAGFPAQTLGGNSFNCFPFRGFPWNLIHNQFLEATEATAFQKLVWLPTWVSLEGGLQQLKKSVSLPTQLWLHSGQWTVDGGHNLLGAFYFNASTTGLTLLTFKQLSWMGWTKTLLCSCE